jgi:hypothetical protein
MSKADATTTEEGATVTVNVDKLIPDETKGPDFTITGSLQIIGSKARSALIGGNLLQTMARARP